MKTALRSMLALAMVLTLVVVATAEDKKEDKKDEKKVVTLKGTLGCAKCVFEVDGIKKCTTSIKVKDGDKEVIYFFIDKGNKESYHKKICTKTAKGQVKGVVSKKDGKMYITPAKDGVKYD